LLADDPTVAGAFVLPNEALAEVAPSPA
jgi:hypothetical protein